MPNLKLTDGRFLEYFDNGIASTSAIIFHHGTPGHAVAWSQWLEEAAARGIRAISFSRAGYGVSDRNDGRTVFSNNEDVRELLDSFGIMEFISIGWSGGGPHAIATSLLNGSRGAITLAGVAPYGAEGLDFLEGMGPENHEEFGAALQGEQVVADWLEVNAASYKNVTGAELRDALGGLIGDADKAVLAGDFAEINAASMRKGIAVSFDGWIDDDMAFIAPWGLDLANLKSPIHLWQGDQDFMVPHAHSYWLEKNIPTAQLRYIPGEGHLSLLVNYRTEILNQAEGLLR